MDELTIHEPDIMRVKVPLPFPLRWVNSYLVRGDDGFTLIDPGLHTAEAEQLWQRVLHDYKIGYGDIERIVLTHYHPDHYGLAGWFQQLSGAPVLLSASGHEIAMRLWSGDESFNEEMTELFRLHGMDAELVREMNPHMAGFLPLVSPQPNVTFIAPGDTVAIGNRQCAALLTPGHAEGHLVFLERATGEIFCGDHILPKISPNISYFPECDPDPLDSYLSSLAEMAELPVTRAYPGHRDPFDEWAGRAMELIDHHRLRLQQMKTEMRRPVSAYQVCRSHFGERLTVHQLRFAMAETLAHMIYLVRRGEIRESTADNGTIMYESVL